MSGQFDNCTSVTPACPVAATTYGYTPNLAGNVVLLAVFGICAIAQLGLGIFYRLPSYASVVTLCCVCEAVGYVGRIIMHNNPWSDVGFKIQIVCLILAPSFLAAGIYLTIKHLVRTLGPQFSRLPPHLYTWIFICFDAISIVIQAVGGGLAATGGDMTDAGGYIMLGGIAIQVATMSVCVLLAIDFAFSVWRASKRPDPSTDLGKFHTKIASRGFKFYLTATAIAFTAILVRCIYRLPEMAGGWGNELMQNEPEFLVLDGAMIALASILMTVAYPGIFFPEMRQKNIARRDMGNFKEPKAMYEADSL